MPDSLIDILGWVPALIFPIATILQLIIVIRAHSAEGISATTWTLFGIANFCLFAYTEKYFEVQAIFGLLGTGIVDFAIVAIVLLRRAKT